MARKYHVLMVRQDGHWNGPEFGDYDKSVVKDELTFDELVNLAFETPPTGDGVQFTIQYTRGHGSKPAGTLLEGGTVKVKEGMEFDVTPTNRS